jgi:hypothetical protein
MGFIETLQDAAQGRALRDKAAEVNASKAAEFDGMRRAEAAMVEAQRQAEIAQRARQEGANEVFNRMAELNGSKGLAAQQANQLGQYVPNNGINIDPDVALIRQLQTIGVPATDQTMQSMRNLNAGPSDPDARLMQGLAEYYGRGGR